MLDELKREIEKTFNRKITDRGACEALSQDVYEKTGAILSYNTLRRLFGLAEYRKPREHTLDQLATYCGFRSYNDFTQRFSEVDAWPSWESLFVSLSHIDYAKLIEMLLFRKRRNVHFIISFTIVFRELIHRKDVEGLLFLLREPAFQFKSLPYDEVAQIGVLVGLNFRNFDDSYLEEQLLQEPNFRDLVFKIFVDYSRLNSKYGSWVRYLSGLQNQDEETRIFVNCVEIWRRILTKEPIAQEVLKSLPTLQDNQHPILFGRIFGIQMLCNTKQAKKEVYKQLMLNRLAAQPQFATELLFEPCVQALATQDQELIEFVHQKEFLINDIKFWYHYSQVAIHQVFQVSQLIKEKKYSQASSVLNHIQYDHIRHGYREFIELFAVFFRWHLALKISIKEAPLLKDDFESRRQRLNYPLLDESYFESYFKS